MCLHNVCIAYSHLKKPTVQTVGWSTLSQKSSVYLHTNRAYHDHGANETEYVRLLFTHISDPETIHTTISPYPAVTSAVYMLRFRLQLGQCRLSRAECDVWK